MAIDPVASSVSKLPTNHKNFFALVNAMSSASSLTP
jgi:hypothetical protein